LHTEQHQRGGVRKSATDAVERIALAQHEKLLALGRVRETRA